jgi:protein arginine kinase activator
VSEKEEQDKPQERRPDGCEGCEKPAEVHYTFMAGGKEVKVHLCGDCPKKQKIEEAGSHGLLEDLAPDLMEDMADAFDQSVMRCPQCGFTMQDLERTKRLGCPECYRTFEAPILQLLQAIQRGSTHVGKFSKRYENKELLENRMNHLKNRLNAAVKDEQYENAAEIRDEIRRLQEAAKKLVN